MNFEVLLLSEQVYSGTHNHDENFIFQDGKNGANGALVQVHAVEVNKKEKELVTGNHQKLRIILRHINLVRVMTQSRECATLLIVKVGQM